MRALPPLISSTEAKTGGDELGRLAAHAVEWLTVSLPTSTMIFTPVDRRLIPFTVAPLVASRDASLDAFRDEYLGQAHALDPFAPSRWSRSPMTVVGACDVGGAQALRGSSFGGFLAGHGLASQASMFFRERGRIVAALVLLRREGEDDIAPHEVRVLRQTQPLLEQALLLTRRNVAVPVDVAPSIALTPREADVARLAAAGATNEEIARALFVSVGTVKTHMSHVLAKYEVRSRTELVTRLRAAG